MTNSADDLVIEVIQNSRDGLSQHSNSKASYFDDPVALDAENFEFDETVQVFQLRDLVLAEVQLLQLGQAVQVLDLADSRIMRIIKKLLRLQP